MNQDKEDKQPFPESTSAQGRRRFLLGGLGLMGGAAAGSLRTSLTTMLGGF